MILLLQVPWLLIQKQKYHLTHFAPPYPTASYSRMSATGPPLWYEVTFGAKILRAYSPLDIEVKEQLQWGENASLCVVE